MVYGAVSALCTVCGLCTEQSLHSALSADCVQSSLHPLLCLQTPLQTYGSVRTLWNEQSLELAESVCTVCSQTNLCQTGKCLHPSLCRHSRVQIESRPVSALSTQPSLCPLHNIHLLSLTQHTDQLNRQSAISAPKACLVSTVCRQCTLYV